MLRNMCYLLQRKTKKKKKKQRKNKQKNKKKTATFAKAGRGGHEDERRLTKKSVPGTENEWLVVIVGGPQEQWKVSKREAGPVVLSRY